MKLERITHACFRLTLSNGKVVYFDPYKMPKGAPKADYIFVSHEHHDHLDVDSITKIAKTGTILVMPASVKKAVAQCKSEEVKPGDNLTFDDFELTVIPAYNINKQFHPKANQWVGYIVKAENKRVLHGGDTDCIPEYSQYQGVDVALLPVGGTYTMDFKDTIKALDLLKPKILVPMHEWDNDLEELREMVKKSHPDVRVEIIKDKPLEL